MVRKFSLPIFPLFLKRESHVPIKDGINWAYKKITEIKIWMQFVLRTLSWIRVNSPTFYFLVLREIKMEADAIIEE